MCVTWSVWGVSGCPGPGWGLVWRSPEENDLGSISPGIPYRFAWWTEGGRERGFTICLQHNRRNLCVLFLAPILIILNRPTRKFLPGNDWSNTTCRSETTPASITEQAKHFDSTFAEFLISCCESWFSTPAQAVFLDFTQRWNHCRDDLTGKNKINPAGKEWELFPLGTVRAPCAANTWWLQVCERNIFKILIRYSIHETCVWPNSWQHFSHVVCEDFNIMCFFFSKPLLHFLNFLILVDPTLNNNVDPSTSCQRIGFKLII